MRWWSRQTDGEPVKIRNAMREVETGIVVQNNRVILHRCRTPRLIFSSYEAGDKFVCKECGASWEVIEYSGESDE